MTMPVHQVPNPESSGQKVHHAIDDAAAKAAVDLAPDVAAARERAKAGHAIVTTHQQLLRDAALDLTAYGRAVGGMIESASRATAVGRIVGLGILGGAETILGFPGLRYALGHHGDILSPFDDPTALVASAGFAVASIRLATAAAHEWMKSDRSVLHEPAPAVVTGESLARGVTDTDDGERTIPAALTDDPLAEPGDRVGGGAVATLPDAGGGADRASDATTAADAPGPKTAPGAARFAPVVRDDVARPARLRRCGLIAFIGVLLWAMNGYLRYVYVIGLSGRTTPSHATGLADLASVAATPHAPAGLEAVLIALGVLFFLAMIVVAARGRSALALRLEDLERRYGLRTRSLQRALKRTAADIRAYERLRARWHYVGEHAKHLHGTTDAERGDR